MTESLPGPCEAVDRSLARPLGGADELVAHLHCSEVRSSDVDVWGIAYRFLALRLGLKVNGLWPLSGLPP